MNISDYVEGLTEKGRRHFTRGELEEALGCSSIAARNAIYRMQKKGALAMPVRGFNVVVPPEYRSVGCLPAIQFVPQLMEHLGLKYYIGLLSAAELHGAAHQRPQIFQIIVARNRRDISCGKLRLRFVARRNIEKMPTISRNTPRGYAVVATPESTAIDLVGYPKHSGGFNNVATILIELGEILDGARLVEVAQVSPMPWAQRLGYLLDYVGMKTSTEKLAEYVAENAGEYVPLISWREVSSAPKNPRWKLLINEEIEADL